MLQSLEPVHPRHHKSYTSLFFLLVIIYIELAKTLVMFSVDTTGQY